MSFLPQTFMKYLQPSERLGVFLAAVESMRAPSLYSTKLAAHMVDVLAAETDFHSGQVGTRQRPGHGSSPRGSVPALVPAPSHPCPTSRC